MYTRLLERNPARGSRLDPLLDGGHVPQIAGGAVVGYRFGAYELLVNVGLAYATEETGSPGYADSNQTKATYDLSLSMRYDINYLFICRLQT
jgi:hypothetical protein